MNAFMMLVRREFWEHRGLWIAPLVVAAVLIVMLSFSGVTSGGFQISVDDVDVSAKLAGTELSVEQKAKLFGVFIAALGLPILITMIIVVFFYLADCLYAERKDRSILFWKSLPVSDAATVWSKVATALVAVPLIVWAIAVVTVTLGFLIGSARIDGTPLDKFVAWDTGIWLTVQGVALANMLVASLWYAPIAGYMLAVSAWARRSVLMWIVLPPVFVTWVEEILFDTNRFAAFLGHRLTGFFKFLGDDDAAGRGAKTGKDIADRIAMQYDTIGATDLLTRAELWAGVVVAVGLVYVAIRMRRYRDDT